MAVKYLVTGGAGFIGSHLCDALLAAGHEVTSIDDLSTGSADNIARLAGNPRFRSIEASLLDSDALSKALDDRDAVFHLAAAVGVDLILRQRVAAIETNVVGTAGLLRLCSERMLPVLIASSSEVYGRGDGVPFSENDDLVLGSTSIARWSYGCGKALDEFLALAYAEERRLPVAVARLFNTTGPGQTGRYGMVLPRFVRQALDGQPITVYGDGTQSRCFCHVDDITGALIALMDCKSAIASVVNIGSDEEVTMNELAALVIEQTESKSEIVHVAYEPKSGSFEDMQRRVPDLARARELISFQPKHSLHDIVADVVRHERARD